MRHRSIKKKVGVFNYLNGAFKGFYRRLQPGKDKIAIRGCLDEVTEGVAKGWAQDSAHPKKRLMVEVLDNGKVVACREATQLRPDLVAVKIGDGRYGFQIPLPLTKINGTQHIITARAKNQGQSLDREVRIKVNFDGAITGLESIDIVGWATIVPKCADNPLEISIWESGKVIAHGIANHTCVFGDCGFRIALPSKYLDGCSYSFIAKEKDTGHVIDNITVTTPNIVSNGPILSCKVAGVFENYVFGWLRITTDFDPSKVDIIIESSGVRGKKILFGKYFLEPNNESSKTLSFVTQFGKSGVPLKSFVFLDRQTNSVIGSIPITLNTDSGWGAFDRIEGIHCSGWALTPEGNIARVELLVDGTPSTSSPAIIAHSELFIWDLPFVNLGFLLQLPETALDGCEHEISVRIIGNREPLSGSKRIFKYAPLFHIDSVSESNLNGWILNIDSDDSPIHLDAFLENTIIGSTKSTITRDDVYRMHGRRYVGFDIQLDRKNFGIWNSNGIKLYFAGTMIPALPVNISMISVTPDYSLIKAVENVASMLKYGATNLLPSTREDPPNAAANEVIRRQLIPKLISEVREAVSNGKKTWTVKCYANTPTSSPVNIIIPVYKGYIETMDCIESVLDAEYNAEYDLVVINDCSPDPRLTDALRSLAKEKKFILIENEKNLGFVATVNRGMALNETEGRDVVLLNSDTLVPQGWLDSLQKAAYSSPNIGTVTPFSNRATICSIPRPQFDNDMVDDTDCQSMHDICAKVNGGKVVDIPTAIGFCMYIRRQVLREVGPFDEQTWKKGYGEENDFCMKARSIGWRSVAATGVFVQHHGSISFAEEKDERVNENLKILNQRYPDYQATIQNFIRKDPLSNARSLINLEILKRKTSQYVLHIGHSWGGGTARAIRDLAEGLATEGIFSLIMEPKKDSVVFSNMDRNVSVCISLKNGLTPLVKALKTIGVVHIHIHQTIGYPASIRELPLHLEVNYDVSIHDYYFICPRIQLINNNGMFCEQPEVEVCEFCCSTTPLEPDIEAIFEELGGTVADWRTYHGGLMEEARMVIAPSNDACNRIQRYLNLDNIQTLPHPESGKLGILRSAQSEKINVAVIGAIGPHKGSELLLRCAKYAKAKGIPISFFIIGYTNMDNQFSDLDNVVITGKYKSADLPNLIEACGCSIALFLSIWPETYSYTLSEVLEQGLTPVAFDLGAFDERIEDAGRGFCIPFLLSAKTIVETLSTALMIGDSGADGKAVGSNYRSLVVDYYGWTPQL